uniref:Uncharacterized protein n=1 Tax=Oryza sativa subsp. japonica TaxID=39947 RepID=Q6ZGK6_ORYSJ|nr:hypothetical protein [Oryza sativa Japonica Group]
MAITRIKIVQVVGSGVGWGAEQHVQLAGLETGWPPAAAAGRDRTDADHGIK